VSNTAGTAAASYQPKLLQNLWSAEEAAKLDARPLDLLRYRSNLLGADLRITNFGGGNTSSKFDMVDPLTGQPQRVMAVKGSGGDLRSIANSGFAILYLDKLNSLIARYRGEAEEDEMVAFYPLCAFGENRVAASIDTPLHAFLPFPHVDHLHPDWAIALAASANGQQKMEEFNKKYGRKIIWVPWQRPGFELALMLKRAVEATPGCDGLILGGHGLFTWGDTQQGCYLNSIRTIDEMGDFIQEHMRRRGAPLFGGPSVTTTVTDRESAVAELLPYLRGVVSSNRRVIAHFDGSDDALTFANSKWAEDLCRMGTSCPDHFLRTRISPMFIPWNPASEDLGQVGKRIGERVEQYRKDYAEYYAACADKTSPKLRDSNPSVVVVPGLGLFGFGKDKREARITSEFFVNAIHVMAGANALEDDASSSGPLPQVRRPEQARDFKAFHNYVALPRTEAFRIEYWALEEAKLQRMPKPKPLATRIALVTGAASGIGKAIAQRYAAEGACVVIADLSLEKAQAAAAEIGGADVAVGVQVDVSDEAAVQSAIAETLLAFGGLDLVVNNAGLSLSKALLETTVADWDLQHAVMARGSFLVAREAAKAMVEQRLGGDIVYISSKNSVFAGPNNIAYSATKADQAHQVRLLAAELGEHGIRVNGINPDGVVQGSGIFASGWGANRAAVYGVEEKDLGQFYAQRTILKREVLPEHIANAAFALVGPDLTQTTGLHVPVDSGVAAAFLR
jgi:rhamnose utilization protein RhaD (predicted bifunctional aldolase and dehydrogenase)/NAD(P)-dependent dehydrogenase (short-subunit alcohol dehydrogenase family)